jgi:hypothetical protein
MEASMPRSVLTIVAVVALASCSRSNNLLLGRVEGVVAGHTVVVTDCYRTRVPPPVAEPNGATFTPCRDAVVAIRDERLTVNGASYGPLLPHAKVVVDHGRVSIEKP